MCVATPSCPCTVPHAHTEGWKGQNPLLPASPPIEASPSTGTAPQAGRRHSTRGTAAPGVLGTCNKPHRKTHILHPWLARPGEGDVTHVGGHPGCEQEAPGTELTQVPRRRLAPQHSVVGGNNKSRLHGFGAWGLWRQPWKAHGSLGQAGGCHRPEAPMCQCPADAGSVHEQGAEQIQTKMPGTYGSLAGVSQPSWRGWDQGHKV